MPDFKYFFYNDFITFNATLIYFRDLNDYTINELKNSHLHPDGLIAVPDVFLS
ncbi:hypothetical protein BH11BAC3_BH11BAC3_25050 [soil metagenome]